MNIGGDVKFGGQAAILAVTNLFAVHPQVERGIYSIENDEDLSSIPVRWNGKGRPVGACFVGVLRNIGRIAFVERIVRVHVAWNTIPQDLPVARNGKQIPAARVEIRAVEISRCLVWVRGKMELPLAIQKPKVGRLIPIARKRRL